MNHDLLNTEVQAFINSNLNADITKLLLNGKSIEGVAIKAIVEQIEAKQKSKNKLPTWFQKPGILFPNKLNIEQTSSEITAEYKSKLISGELLIDITGGFGVDTYYFSKQFSEVVHCELNSELSQIVAHNFKQFDLSNTEVTPIDGLAYLNKTNVKFDWIYIDPSRRHEVKGKVFFLEDCLPNVPEQLDFLFSRANNIMIKTAPLLDIAVGLKSLKHVASIHVVSVKNEVKELLWLLKKGHTEQTIISTVNLIHDKAEMFEFPLTKELDAIPSFGMPSSFLFEPNVAIYKSGAFKLISERLKVDKLHANSHLYTSDSCIEFPGRRFKIDKALPFNKKVIQRECPKKANITTRNFPLSVSDIRKKYGIKEGGSIYLFFTTNIKNEKIVLLCSKVN